MLTSAAVTSTAVPNVVTVLRKHSSASPARIRSGTAMPLGMPLGMPSGVRGSVPPGSADSSACSAVSVASPVSRASRASRCSTCVRHCARLRIRGAIPRGCSDSRSTLTGGSSRAGSAPSVSSGTPALAATSCQPRSTTTAGKGA